MTTLIWVIGAVVGLSILYRVIPARPLPVSKPEFTLFPRYVFDITNMGTFHNNLERDGFNETGAGRYSRGSAFGDFLASWIKLQIKIDYEAGTAVLGSPFFGIAFDTGDLWNIATGLKTG